MSLTSQEPSSKFWGPPFRLADPKPGSSLRMQLFNLQPGDNFEPPFAAELLAPHTLLP